MDEEQRQNILKLSEAIEEDSRAIAALLQACGPSRAFAPQQACLFEELLNHREQLLVLLAALRGRVRHTDDFVIHYAER
jgi:hypothetical protein